MLADLVLKVAEHVRTKARHAKVTKTTREVADAGGKANLLKKRKKEEEDKGAADKVGALTTLSPKPRVLPKAGVNGVGANSLSGKVFVLTGVFDELPGGVGLARGKGGLTDFITSHGGKVRITFRPTRCTVRTETEVVAASRDTR